MSKAGKKKTKNAAEVAGTDLQQRRIGTFPSDSERFQF